MCVVVFVSPPLRFIFFHLVLSHKFSVRINFHPLGFFFFFFTYLYSLLFFMVVKEKKIRNVNNKKKKVVVGKRN